MKYFLDAKSAANLLRVFCLAGLSPFIPSFFEQQALAAPIESIDCVLDYQLLSALGPQPFCSDPYGTSTVDVRRVITFTPTSKVKRKNGFSVQRGFFTEERSYSNLDCSRGEPVEAELEPVSESKEGKKLNYGKARLELGDIQIVRNLRASGTRDAFKLFPRAGNKIVGQCNVIVK